jgi:hypothetical protein
VHNCSDVRLAFGDRARDGDSARRGECDASVSPVLTSSRARGDTLSGARTRDSGDSASDRGDTNYHTPGVTASTTLRSPTGAAVVLAPTLDTLIAGTLPYDVRAPGGRDVGTGGLRTAGTGGGVVVGGARASSGMSPHDDTGVADAGASVVSESLREGS